LTERPIADIPKDVKYELAEVKKMLHYVNVWLLPFRWGTNTYRGCEHDCIYCNARYTHEYLGLSTGDFAQRIIVKSNAAIVLDKEFSREKWDTKLTVNLATVTDPYQPAESLYKITRATLDTFLRHHNALMLTTKSDLVLGDLDILAEIAQTGFLNVVITLPTLSEDLRNRIEPKAPTVERRLRTIQRLHQSGITVGVAAIPLLPHISDNEKDVEDLIKTVAETGADYVIADLLNFRGEARTRFTKFLADNEPSLVPEYEKLYRETYCEKNYTKRMRGQTNRLIKKYKVDNYDRMFSYRKGQKSQSEKSH